MTTYCPRCGGPSHKVLYMGAPGRLCQNDECCCLWGPAGRLLEWFPWNIDGTWNLMVYEGPWWRAFWAWLTAPKEEQQ